MNANELRLNNLVFDRKGVLCKVTKLDTNSHETQIEAWPVNGSPIVNPDFSPIPLTEKWLKRYGFKDDNTKYYFYLKMKSKWYLFWNKKDGAGLCTNEIEVQPHIYADEIIIKKGIKFVHQLQNIYFALTGTELTLNE